VPRASVLVVAQPVGFKVQAALQPLAGRLPDGAGLIQAGQFGVLGGVQGTAQLPVRQPVRFRCLVAVDPGETAPDPGLQARPRPGRSRHRRRSHPRRARPAGPAQPRPATVSVPPGSGAQPGSRRAGRPLALYPSCVGLREVAGVQLYAVLMLGGIALTAGLGGRLSRLVTRVLLAVAVTEVAFAAAVFAMHLTDPVTVLLLAGSIAATYAIAGVQARRLRHKLSVIRSQLRLYREQRAFRPGRPRR